MTFDQILVGAGPAASVAAWRLSADPAVRVLVLEAGGASPSLLRRALARRSKPPTIERLWPYETVPQSGLNGRRIFLPQGRALGGASAINAMTYLRGRPEDYEAWALEGNYGWDAASVLAAYKRLERNHAIVDEHHGQEGPLDVSDLVAPHRLSRAFVDAARDLGFPANRDFNGATQEGVGLYQVTQRKGHRRSAADAFIRPVLDRPNLTVLTGAVAQRILVEGRRAVGVEFVHRGVVTRARAEAGVIVSGGGINSAKLLLLSGIGPADSLRRVGIPVVHDLPGVGHNLHDHLNVQVIAGCRGGTYDRWDRPHRLLRFGLEYLLFNSGIATSNLCEAGGFLRSAPERSAPDLQLHFLPLIWRDYGRAREGASGVTLEVAFLHPRSRGRVSLSSSDPGAPPVIDPAYCADRTDLERLVDGLEICREILAAPSMAQWMTRELYPGPAACTREALAAYARDTAVTAYHPVGTCRMGIDGMAVVDPRLRVRGLDALRVIDVSVMPSIISASTQASAMMIGEMGASMALEDGR